MTTNAFWTQLRAASARDLRTLQVKWTYIGSQRKSLPSVAFTTCFHRLRMDWFEPLRRSGLSYANDDNDIWNFTTTPEEMAGIVDGLARLGIIDHARADSAMLSLSVVVKESRIGESGAEFLLDRSSAEAAVTTVLGALGERNGVGHHVATLFWESVPG